MDKTNRGKTKGSKTTQFKKGYIPWNFEGKGKLKRKFVRKDGKFMLNTHYVFCFYYRLKEIPKGFIIHHKDGNSLNDSIDNLVMMTDKSHKQFHNKLALNKVIAGKSLNGKWCLRIGDIEGSTEYSESKSKASKEKR